mgnify:CR=1 FL=1
MLNASFRNNELRKIHYSSEEKEDIIEKYLYAKYVNKKITPSKFVDNLSMKEGIEIEKYTFFTWLKEKGVIDKIPRLARKVEKLSDIRVNWKIFIVN